MKPLPKHDGETCLILGNGPSLNLAPESLLKAYPTFGCNYINRKPFQPTYYVCIDTTVLTKHAAEIYPVTQRAERAFISDYIPPNPDLDKLRALPNHYSVGRETFVFQGELFMSGNTAVYVCLKIAYFMGFKTALLIGVDHSQSWEHFTPNYPLGSPTRYEGQRFHFAIAQDVYKAHGRKIINLSNPSALDTIFERKSLLEIVDKIENKA